MFTPQEIQEKTFVKAVFGGYDMTSVDEFLEPLTEDYIALYKENAVLKSKMKILVEKLEEYRGQEESMKKAIIAAQMTSDQMIAEAEKKCAQMTSKTETALRARTAETQQLMAAEEERIERAKQAAQNFIEIIEKDVSRHLELLNNLKLMNLGAAMPKPRVYDYEREAAPQPAPEPIPEPIPTLELPPEQPPAGEAQEPREEPVDETQQIAAEIEQNLEKVIGPDDDDLEKTRVGHSGINFKFVDLQFGKNYDPTHQ